MCSRRSLKDCCFGHWFSLQILLGHLLSKFVNNPFARNIKKINVIICILKLWHSFTCLYPFVFPLRILFKKKTISLFYVMSPNAITGERKTNTHEYKWKRVILCLVVFSENMPLTRIITISTKHIYVLSMQSI
jgi:hypothetical protein